MNAPSPDGPGSSRALYKRIIFAVALVLLLLCALATVAEQQFGWKPPEIVRQAIKFFRNR